MDYLSYCQFLPFCVVSNPITYKKYEFYMNNEKYIYEIPLEKSLINLGKDFLRALLCGAIYFFGVSFFPSNMVTKSNFTSNSFFYIFGYTTICTFFIKFKYFFSFKLCMLPIHASGITSVP